MSCAIANAVFDVVEKENLRENAIVVGEYLLDSCHMLAKKHSSIGDVRGAGLFVGIELVKDRKLRNPDTESAKYVVSRLVQKDAQQIFTLPIVQPSVNKGFVCGQL